MTQGNITGITISLSTLGKNRLQITKIRSWKEYWKRTRSAG